MSKITKLNKAKEFLESCVEARERKNRYSVIVTMLVKEFPKLKDIGLNSDNIKCIIQEGMTINRNILRNQQLFENLRGTDYIETKKILEQKKKLELGYEPGYRQDINKLKTLL